MDHRERIAYREVMVWLEDQQKVVYPVNCDQWNFNKIKEGDEVLLAKLNGYTINVYAIVYDD